jgi:hypothetical protein
MSHSPKVGLYLVVYGYEKTYRTGRAGDLGTGIAQKLFIQKPYVHLRIPRIALSALLAPYRAKPGTATGFPGPTTGR